ncbi:hypothetical protein Pmani_036595 [Petrolisthes manimaculis]|uniref:Uncharacterized protein n=1 Tax=Petrolisthes manimaculis TaxID=1843537 RepID=A0AAE1TM93_9EUCA|nr:hypothetical protein Pmani_036595 [Petrolisthes manimaculis]
MRYPTPRARPPFMRGGEEDAVPCPPSPPPPEVAWSPDTDHPDAWVRREDVILKWGADSLGEQVPFYKARTIATPTPSSSKVSTVTTLDAMGFLVDIDKLNSSEAWKVDRSSDTPKIFLSSDAFFPADRGEGDTAAVSLHRGVEPVSMEDMHRSMSDMVSSLVPTLFPQLLPFRLPIPAPASHGVGRGGAYYLPSCL